MEKDTIIKIALTAVLAVYLVFALAMTGAAERADRYNGLSIAVADSIGSGFVSDSDVAQECGDLYNLIRTSSRENIDLNALEQTILSMPVVENANVMSLCDGSLHISVSPMVPVARVFDPTGHSYYINASGKRVMANARYHVDVPVVVGNFDASTVKPEALLPMLSHIAADPTINALVSTVTLSKKGDIILVPVIRGQVINFGDTANVADKFARLKTFYTEAMPVKGWNTYDTISVKWARQVVASRRDKSLGTLSLATQDSEFDFIDDISTMTSDDAGFIEDDTTTHKSKN
ncbi:MAG: cell division protein FtsQ/DivIB [Muribaculaceae bacterium]|nr:cell division protein FtsQ/DivIB [Muribaculaceae bacterium]